MSLSLKNDFFRRQILSVGKKWVIGKKLETNFSSAEKNNRRTFRAQVGEMTELLFFPRPRFLPKNVLSPFFNDHPPLPSLSPPSPLPPSLRPASTWTGGRSSRGGWANQTRAQPGFSLVVVTQSALSGRRESVWERESVRERERARERLKCQFKF